MAWAQTLANPTGVDNKLELAASRSKPRRVEVALTTQTRFDSFLRVERRGLDFKQIGSKTQTIGAEGTGAQKHGGLAQLGERLHGMQEVIGSSPLSSIRFANRK